MVCLQYFNIFTLIIFQANLVREMKGSGKPKAEWQPHVSALLQLKADLAAAQKAAESQKTSAPSTASSSETAQPAQIAELEEAVKKQVTPIGILLAKKCMASNVSI